MSETAVIDEPSAELRIETPPAHSTPAQPRHRSIPARKQRRFFARLRFNGLRYVTLAATLLLAWGLVRLAMWRGAGTVESTFVLVLVGGLLAAAAKTGIDLMSWAEANRQALHVERVHAVQRVFQRACAVRDQAQIDWRRIHTILVNNLAGHSEELRLFRDHDETDRLAERLWQKALSEETWIRPDGVNAVRGFRKEIAALDYDALATESEFLFAFNTAMERLRRDLALAAVGVRLD